MSRRCLLDTIDMIRRDPDMSPELRDLAVSTLTSIAEDSARTAAQTRAALVAASRDLRRAAYEEKVTVAARDMKTEEILTRLNTIQDPAERALVWRGMLEGRGGYSPGVEGPDISSRIRAVEGEVFGALNRAGVWDYISESRITRRLGTITQSDGAKQLALALEGKVDGVDPKALELAQKWREVIDPLLEQIRQSGKYVGQIEDWGYRSWSPSRVARDYTAFRAEMVKRLDPVHHPDPEATVDVMYKSINVRHVKEDINGTFTMGRKLFFKTPDDAVEMTMRFGDTDMHFGLLSVARRVARQSVLTKELGPMPGQTLDTITARLREDAAYEAAQARAAMAEATTPQETAKAKSRMKAAKKAETESSRTEVIGEAITGELGNPANHTLAGVAGAARNWMVAQHLGQVPLLMLTQDSLIGLFGGRFHTGGFGKSVSANMRAMLDILGDSPQVRQYIEEIGVWNHAMVMTAMDRFATPYAMSELVKGKTGQAATAMQRLAGTHALERSLRSASMLVVSRSLMRNLAMGWDDLPKSYHKVLEGNGFNKAKWKDLQTHARVAEGVGAVDYKALPAHLKEHVTAFLYKEADYMTLYPGYYDRALLTFGGRAGTYPGEFTAIATQFWSWPTSFVRKVMAREMAMGGAGFVGFSAGMMAAAVLSTQAYAYVKNEPMFEWDSPELWMRAAVRSGLLTPIGGVVAEAARHDKIEIGPVGGTGVTLVKSLTHTIGDVVSGESDRLARRSAQLTKELVIPNLWHMEWAVTSRAMDAIIWEYDPDYARRRDRRWDKEGRM